MAIHIDTISGGDIIIVPISQLVTRFRLNNGDVEEYNIQGSLNDVWMQENGFQSEDTGDNVIWNKDVVEVQIGQGVDEIGEFAFYSSDKGEDEHAQYTLENLSTITIPETVKYIGAEAFSGCTGLQTLEIPDNVLEIDDDAFRDCTSLTQIAIGSGVTHIGARAFSGCETLTQVTMENGMVSINESAFSFCGHLQSISIPSSVQHLGFGVFDGCLELTQVEMLGFTKFQVCSNAEYWGLPEDCVVTCSNGIYTVGGDKPEADDEDEPEATPEQLTSITILDNGDEQTENHNIRGAWTDKWNIDHDFQDPETYEWTKTIKSIAIGTNVNEIGEFAFYDEARQAGQTGMGLFESIRIPNTVTRVGSWSFANCSALPEMSIPDSVVKIGNSAFTDCNGLESVAIGNGIEYLGPRAFKDCLVLREVTFSGNKLKTIGNGAFNGCGNLTTVNIPNGTTYIGGYAFYECASLSELEIPASVKYIGKNAFLGTNLEILEIAGFTMEQVNEKAEGWGIPKGCKVACSNGSAVIGEEDGKE